MVPEAMGGTNFPKKIAIGDLNKFLLIVKCWSEEQFKIFRPSKGPKSKDNFGLHFRRNVFF